MKWLLRIAVLVVLTLYPLCTVSHAQLTIWGLASDEDLNNPGSAVTTRFGYQIGQIEPFVGSVWYNDYPTDPGEQEPPQVLEVGVLLHLPDLIDSNSPFPLLPDIILMAIPEGADARPYFGPCFTVNLLDKDSGKYGLKAGVEYKKSPDIPISIVMEVEYADYFGALSAIHDNELLFSAGVKWRTK